MDFRRFRRPAWTAAAGLATALTALWPTACSDGSSGSSGPLGTSDSGGGAGGGGAGGGGGGSGGEAGSSAGPALSPAGTLASGQKHVLSLSFSPDGKRLASTTWERVTKVWRIEEREVVFSIDGLSDTAAIYTLDGTMLASGRHENVALFRATDGAGVRSQHTGYNSNESTALSNDGKLLAAGSFDQAFLLQMPNLTLIRTLSVDESRDFLSLAFSPSAKWLAGAIGEKVLVYDQMTGTLSHTLTGHTDYTRSVVFSPDGKQLASSSDDNIIRLWSTDTWTLEQSLTGDSEWTQVAALAYSPDGRYLISAGCAYVVDGKCTKGNLALWDIEGGVLLAEIDAAHSTWITAMALSADGKTIATGCDNGYIKLWTLEVP